MASTTPRVVFTLVVDEAVSGSKSLQPSATVASSWAHSAPISAHSPLEHLVGLLAHKLQLVLVVEVQTGGERIVHEGLDAVLDARGLLGGRATTAICPSAYTELPPAILCFSMTRTAAPALAAS